MKTLLTIAGFDPSSGAGISADLAVFSAHGHFGTSVITSLTVQSTLGVRDSEAVRAELLRETLAYLHQDMPPAGVKIGMLATRDAVSVVADYLEQLRRDHPGTPVVIDPVIRSSSGRELLAAAAFELFLNRLLPLADWITPNTAELALLSSVPVASHNDLEPASRQLQAALPNLGVFATGGHLDPPDDLLLPRAGAAHWLPGERIDSTSTHGTGCALSSAFLSRLVLGDDPVTAASAAKSYVAQAIRRAPGLGKGHGPLNHLWPLLS